MSALEDAVERTSKTTTVEISATHTRKYKQLKGNNKSSSTNLENKDKWAKNISKRTLSPVKIAALMEGFNFAITPKKVPVSKILSSIENSIYSLSQTAKDIMRVGVINALRTCKTPFSANISNKEENALKNLRKDDTITILPADKGKSVVVMDSDEYKQKVSTLLDDTKTYLQFTNKRLNPTTRVEKDLNKLLLNIKVDNTGTTPQIGPNLYKKLHCNNSTPPSFCGLPKIHKPERSLRLITSSIGSPTYAVSKHLVSILSPLRKNTYTV